MLFFEDLIKENKAAFIARVNKMATFLGVKPDWLMFCFWFETAHTMNSHIQNKIGATGLIQFLESTAIGLGTTTAALKVMSNVQQLEYVEKHLSRFRGKYKSFVDLYCAIFWPAAVGQPDSYRITSDKVAAQNPIFDINRDTDIEKSEIRAALLKQIPIAYKHLFV
jgi:hypothetical protein